MTSFGIFQVPRLVEELEHALERGVALRIVLGDRESHSDQAIDRQRYQLGPSGDRQARRSCSGRPSGVLRDEQATRA